MNSAFSSIVILTERVSWPFKSFAVILPIFLDIGAVENDVWGNPPYANVT